LAPLIEVYIEGGEGARILVHVDGFLLLMIASMFVVISGARRCADLIICALSYSPPYKPPYR
jgi:hypothetical protein